MLQKGARRGVTGEGGGRREEQAPNDYSRESGSFGEGGGQQRYWRGRRQSSGGKHRTTTLGRRSDRRSLLVFSLASFAQCLTFSFYCSYMSTIYPVISFSLIGFCQSRCGSLDVLGLAYMITGVAVYLIFFLFCTFTEQRTSPSKTFRIYLLFDPLFHHRLSEPIAGVTIAAMAGGERARAMGQGRSKHRRRGERRHYRRKIAGINGKGEHQCYLRGWR